MTELIKRLEWDSNFFGLKVGAYAGNTIGSEQAAQLAQAIDIGDYDCIYAFLDPHDLKTLQAAAQNKFLLIDTRLLYEFVPRNNAERALLIESAGANVEMISSADKEAADIVRKIARDMSIVSRFHMDEDFRPHAADLYEIWADKILNAPEGSIVGIKEGGKLLGFIGCELKDGIGELVLVAVSEEARGGGIGQRMIQGAMAHLLTLGARKILVKTQMHNIIGNRVYQRCGFVQSDSKLIYHIKQV